MTELQKEEEKFIVSLKRKLNKTIQQYGLIADGDVILVGLSGGKDSLALVELLGERKKIHKPSFRIIAAHISVENIPYTSDLAYLEAFCQQYDVPFVHRSTSFDASTDTRKSPCFLCSWTRRKQLFDIAKELGCNKIALGHHQDDILQTLLMNMSFQGAFSTMPPLLKMNKFDMTIIRPMCLLREKELEQLASIKDYQKQVKNCPYEKDSYRKNMKELIQQLEIVNPEVHFSLWNAMTNIQHEYLPQKIK
jgi:tRNA 2-thiocytidine biosynthesis protein TtcA